MRRFKKTSVYFVLFILLTSLICNNVLAISSGISTDPPLPENYDNPSESGLVLEAESEPRDVSGPGDLPELGDSPEPGDLPEPGDMSEPGDLPEPGDVSEPGDLPEPGDTSESEDTPDSLMPESHLMNQFDVATDSGYSIEVTVAPGDDNANRAQFFTDLDAIITVSGVDSGVTPVLYDENGQKITDNQEGSSEFKFDAIQSVYYYAGTFDNNTTTTYTINSSEPIILIRNGEASVTEYTIAVSVEPGTSNDNRAQFFTDGNATISASGAASGVTPSLYDESGQRITDNQEGSSEFKYETQQSVYYYAGTYGNDTAATYTITSSEPITLIRNGELIEKEYRIEVSVTPGNTNASRAEFYTQGAAIITSTEAGTGVDPALYNGNGQRIADDEGQGRNWQYTSESGTRYYAGTYGNNTTVTYTIVSTAPITWVRNGAASEYTIEVTITPGSSNASRAEFYTTGSAIITSTEAGTGVDPALYNGNGQRIADDEAGSRNWSYTTEPGTRYYAGTYGSNVTATYKIKSTAPIMLVRNGATADYSIEVTVTPGTSKENRAEFYTTGYATITSKDAQSGTDPALYNGNGNRIADDEAGNRNWRYAAEANTHYYAGTYGNNITATYKITSTAPIYLVRNGLTPDYSIEVTITPGSSNENRAEFYTTGTATITSKDAQPGTDPALYNGNGYRIADDEAGNRNWRYTAEANTHYYAGTYGNSTAATYKITSTAPIMLVRNGITPDYSIEVTITSGSSNENRAEFYTTGTATITSKDAQPGTDPALYNGNGYRIADDEAGNRNWRYTAEANTHYYAGTYGNNIAATYKITSTAPIYLVRNGITPEYSIEVTITPGISNENRAEFYTSGRATIASKDASPGTDPALYDASGYRIADDEAGSRDWRYTAESNTYYYAGTYGNNIAATYKITSTAPIYRVRNGLSPDYSIEVTIAQGNSNTSRAEFYTIGDVTITSKEAGPGIDPALYNANGYRIADDEDGNRNWRYTASAGTYYYAGTYGNTAGTYKITSTAPIYLVRNGAVPIEYSITVTVAQGSSNTNRAQFYTDSNATIKSSGASSSVDPVLYSASGNTLADDTGNNRNWQYTAVGGTYYYAGTYNNSAGTYTITSTEPIHLVRDGSANIEYSITVIVAQGSSNTNRAQFYTTGAATIKSSGASSSVNPALYNANGYQIADDEDGNRNWRYTASAGTYYYAGTYNNTAGTYKITSTAPIYLVRDGTAPIEYSITVTVAQGSSNINRAQFYTTGAATIKSSGASSSVNPALYNANGYQIADDEDGNRNWRYSASAGTYYYAGTYNNNAGTYTITSTAPIYLERNGSASIEYSITVTVAQGSSNTNRAQFYTDGNATIKSSGASSSVDPALYSASGIKIADDIGDNRNWQYSAVGGTYYYAGTYNNSAGTYTITSTAPIYLVRNGSSAVLPNIASFTTDKSVYQLGEIVYITATAQNFGSWEIYSLSGSQEVASTGIQHSSTIWIQATIESANFTGARLYLYPYANGEGTPVTSDTYFTVY